MMLVSIVTTWTPAFCWWVYATLHLAPLIGDVYHQRKQAPLFFLQGEQHGEQPGAARASLMCQLFLLTCALPCSLCLLVIAHRKLPVVALQWSGRARVKVE